MEKLVTVQEPEVKTKKDWAAAVCLIHMISCLYTVVVFYSTLKNDNISELRWFYLSASAVCMMLHGIVIGLTNKGNRFRHLMTMTFFILNLFLMPLIMNACGSPRETQLVAGVIFTVAAIAVSPLYAVIAYVLGGGIFIFTYHEFAGFEPVDGYMRIMVSYGFMILVAVLWRALISKSYLAFRSLASHGEPEGEDDYTTVSGERDVLRQEIAQHILELNNMMVYNESEKQEG